MNFPGNDSEWTADDAGRIPGEAADGDGSIVQGIDTCLRRWKAARHEGQAVLSGLSNALLLRTYVDEGRAASVSGDASSGAHVWGALTGAGTAVSRVALATEARVRRLHVDLSALQDEMLTAAVGVRRHAQEARRRCCSTEEAAGFDGGSTPLNTSVWKSDKKTAVTPTRGVPGVVGGGYSMGDVADAASTVSEMLLQEALVTATVVRGVGGCQDDRQALTMYAAAWMTQPYLDARRLSELEAMVGARRRS